MKTQPVLLIALVLVGVGAWFVATRGDAEPGGGGWLSPPQSAPLAASAPEAVAESALSEPPPRAEVSGAEVPGAADEPAQERTRERIANLSRSVPPGAPDPPPDPFTIRVRVLDDAGRPVPEARIVVSDVERELRPPTVPSAAPPHTRFVPATVDADGVGRIARVPVGLWRPWAGRSSGPFSPGPEVVVDGMHALAPIDLRVPPRAETAMLRGQVVDSRGVPVAGALVGFYWRELDELARLPTFTGADGTFELSLERRGALWVRLPGDAWGSVLLEDVGPGDPDLRVALPEPRDFLLDPRGPQDLMVEPFSAHFELALLGAWLSEGPPRPPRADRPLVRAVSAMPFRVTVTAAGYLPATVGPIAPQEVGPILRVELQPERVARGRVTLNGEPWRGAWVRFEQRPEPSADPTVQPPRALRQLAPSVLSDSDGGFELPLNMESAGLFDLVAKGPPHGPARIVDLPVDPAHDLEGLELELRPSTGTIRGLLHTPVGRSPSELWVAFQGEHESFHTGVDEQGRFGVEALAAGRWGISVRSRWSEWEGGSASSVGEREWWSHGGPEDPPHWYSHDVTTWVELTEGEVLDMQLDLTQSPACVLQGSLHFDGQPLAPLREEKGMFDIASRSAFLERDGRKHAHASIDARGEFSLAALESGRYRLRIEVALATGSLLTVTDSVELRPAGSTWSVNLITARLSLNANESARPRHDLRHDWRGPGELRVVTRFPVEDGERDLLVFPRVPAGAGALMLEPRSVLPRRLAEFSLPPGDDLVLELP